MGNYLKMADKQRVLALLELGWSYRRIGRETGIRRETVARYDPRRAPKAAKVTAAALVRPDKLSGLTAKSVVKRFGEKRFAAGANREQIALCTADPGIPLQDFIALGLEAMEGIAKELGL